MLKSESTRLQEGPDSDAMTADSGSILCNRPDAKVASPYALKCLLEVLVAGLDAAFANMSFNRIRISKAY
jgi:hypothetical protein